MYQKSSSPPSDNPSERFFCVGALAISYLYSSGFTFIQIWIVWFPNFSQSNLCFILMYKWQGLLQRLVQFYPQNSTCKILRPYGASSIGYNFGHLHWRQIWPLVGNLATKFKIWSSGGATCIGSNVVHQVGSHALPHCLELPYWHYQLVLTWYLHQPESHQLSLLKVSQLVTDIRTQRSDPRFTWVR